MSALGRARVAQASWATVPVQERAQVVRAWGASLLDRGTVLSELLQRGSGFSSGDALTGEVWGAAAACRWVAAHAEEAFEARESDDGATTGRRGWIEYRPHGIVAVLHASTAPLQAPVSALAMALVAGNGVVVSGISDGALAYAMERGIAAGIPRELVVRTEEEVFSLAHSSYDACWCFAERSIAQSAAMHCAEKGLPSWIRTAREASLWVLEDAPLALVKAALLRALCGSARALAPRRVLATSAQCAQLRADFPEEADIEWVAVTDAAAALEYLRKGPRSPLLYVFGAEDERALQLGAMAPTDSVVVNATEELLRGEHLSSTPTIGDGRLVSSSALRFFATEQRLSWGSVRTPSRWLGNERIGGRAWSLVAQVLWGRWGFRGAREDPL